MLILLSFNFIANAQNWQSFGTLNQPPSCFYEDVETDGLLIGGRFTIFNSDTTPGIARLNGETIQRMGRGVEWDCITPVSAGAFYRHPRSEHIP